MRPIKTCIWVNEDETTCGGMAEGNTDYCASHNSFLRKQAKQAAKVKVVTTPRKVSAKQAKELQDYGVLARRYKAEHPECEVRLPGICDGMTTDVHHKDGRGKNLLNEETFIASCRSCHTHIHDKMSKEERREKGLLLTRNETV